MANEREQIIWECECGHRENTTESPDDCPKCLKLDSFTQLPHELAMESSLTMETEDDQ